MANSRAPKASGAPLNGIEQPPRTLAPDNNVALVSEEESEDDVDCGVAADDTATEGNSSRRSCQSKAADADNLKEPSTFTLSADDVAQVKGAAATSADQSAATPNASAEIPTNARSEEVPVAEQSPLPWGPSTPTPEMMAVASRAEQQARHGFDLAQRGALYTARAQFIEVLRTLADAMDAQRNTTAHSKALANGLRALEEVNDFVPHGTSMESDINMRLIVDAHHTPVLKDRPLDGITPTVAQRMYLTYAQEQLAAAAGDQSVASLALHGLGKVCAAPAEMHGPREQIADAKAVVFYQAALVVEPRNCLAANELGVLLVKFGHLEEARCVLEQSVAVSNAPTTWRNLGAVYHKLGDESRAMHARMQADDAVAQLQKTNRGAGGKYPIEWLDPESFAQTSSMMPNSPPATASSQSANESTQIAAKPEKKSSSFWPWK